MHGIAQPRVGILNIGEEETKGDSVVQDAARLLSASKLNYVGFVEGDDIFSGEVDVVVTDGFTGNVALKTMEGLANMLVGALKTEYTRNPLRYVGAVGILAGAALAAPRVRSAHLQRRQHGRTERHRHQEPRQRRRAFLPQRHSRRADRGAQGRADADRQPARAQLS